MYLGQLPKLCRTLITNPPACTALTTPFKRLRRRVCGSMPSTPSEAPTRSVRDSASALPGNASMASVCALGVWANPGGPASIDACGRPSSSTLPTSRNGSLPNNSRCCAGMWSRMTKAPTSARRSRMPTRCCSACSPL